MEPKKLNIWGRYKTWWIVLMAITVFVIGSILIGHYVLEDIADPSNITVPQIGKNPPFQMEAVPISKIGKKKPTFRELW